jgi:hypothetical protein
MQIVTLKPAIVDGEPLKVRKPQGGYLAVQGEPIVLTTYWRRRRDDGDVTEVGAASQATEPADTPPAPTKSASAKGTKPAAE